MRNISFGMTTQQIIDGTKTVTRRTGWRFLKPGDLLCGVVKAQGLKKGEKIQRLRTVRVVDVRREPLITLFAHPYGFNETTKEGFPDGHRLNWPPAFVDWFLSWHRGMVASDEVTRIEFEYVD